VISERVAVVTGGNRGIGLEICRQLARQGIRVVLGSRSARRGEQACRELNEAGLSVVPYGIDVTQAADVQSLARFIEDQFGRVDILVNNAGIMIDPPGSRLADYKPETYRTTLETNVLGPIAVAQALLPFMKRRRYGRIVNMSSGLGQLSEMGGGTPAYRLSKAALNAVTRMLAAEGRADNILANSMCPGWVKTRMGGPNAPRTVDQAADTALWLAMLPEGGPSGGFFRDRTSIPW
jgi:NAD(P)-dependent dehydrogenase (short-subunit alcohol dehydrogenase family)